VAGRDEALDVIKQLWSVRQSATASIYEAHVLARPPPSRPGFFALSSLLSRPLSRKSSANSKIQTLGCALDWHRNPNPLVP
jgi:hypothetical protein